MPGGITPGRHVFLDAFVVRHDFEHLAQRQFFNFLRRHDDRHRAEVPQRIELYIGLYHSVPYCVCLVYLASLVVNSRIRETG